MTVEYLTVLAAKYVLHCFAIAGILGFVEVQLVFDLLLIAIFQFVYFHIVFLGCVAI